MAKLFFRYGAMGSSKTANALMTRYNFLEKGKNVLLIKPDAETRDEKRKSDQGSGWKQIAFYGLSSRVTIIIQSKNWMQSL